MPSKHSVRRTIGAAVLVLSSTGLPGCAVPEGTNLADLFGDYAGFCGIFQDCGSDSDTNRGGNQNATGDSDDGSGSSGTTGGEDSAVTDGD